MKYPKSPMLFDCFDPDCGAALIIAVAEAMSAGLSDNQMNVLGTFLSAVADTISYMAAQISYNKDICLPGGDTDRKDEPKEEDSDNSEESNIEDGSEEGGDNGSENGMNGYKGGDNGKKDCRSTGVKSLRHEYNNPRQSSGPGNVSAVPDSRENKKGPYKGD